MSFIQRIAKFFSRFNGNFSREVSDVELNELRSFMRRGDIIFTHTPAQVSNFFIRGKYDHCGMIVDGGVVEARTAGVNCYSLRSLLESTDGYILAREEDIDPEDMLRLQRVAMDFANDEIEYDWWFWGSNIKRYCSELVYDIYEAVFEDCSPIQDYKGIIHPMEILDDNERINQYHKWGI